MRISKLLDLLERVESEMASFYYHQYENHLEYKQVADFFLSMHQEENSHVQFVRMERRIMESAPKVFKEARINLSEINATLKKIAWLKTADLSFTELVNHIYHFENSEAERYWITALKDTNPELRNFLMQLSVGFGAHADKVAGFARSVAVELKPAENDFRGHTRVGYKETVLINGTRSAKGVDMSEGGMFLMSDGAFAPGESITVQFPLEERFLTLTAVIQYELEAVGIGIQFSGLETEDRDAIRRYVARNILEPAPNTKKRVLLVGGRLSPNCNVQYFSHALTYAGHKAIAISTIPDALSALRKGMDLSCLVLMVEAVADPSFFLLRFVRSVAHYQDLPVIAVAGLQEKGLREALTSQGVNVQLDVSIATPKRLLEEIEKIPS